MPHAFPRILSDLRGSLCSPFCLKCHRHSLPTWQSKQALVSSGHGVSWYKGAGKHLFIYMAAWAATSPPGCAAGTTFGGLLAGNFTPVGNGCMAERIARHTAVLKSKGSAVALYQARSSLTIAPMACPLKTKETAAAAPFNAPQRVSSHYSSLTVVHNLGRNVAELAQLFNEARKAPSEQPRPWL